MIKTFYKTSRNFHHEKAKLPIEIHIENGVGYNSKRQFQGVIMNSVVDISWAKLAAFSLILLVPFCDQCTL